MAASVTYQSGLRPPGGLWQEDNAAYSAGNPILHDVVKRRYDIFFYSNSISFMASKVVLMMLLPHWLPNENGKNWAKWSLRVMNWTILLDLVTLLVAYAAGSNRGWKTSVYAIVLIVAVLGYFVIHMTLSRKPNQSDSSSSV